MRDKYRFQLYNQGFNKTPLGKHYADLIASSRGKDRQYYYQSRKQYVRITYDIAQAKRDRAIDSGKVRREKARLAALRKSNRVRRFRNTSSWFVQWTPILLFGFLATMFFGGLTTGIINSHTERVYYGDSDLYVDIFDYDYTFKLTQLSKLRNIFDIKSEEVSPLLLTYRDTLKDYYDKGFVEYIGESTFENPFRTQWSSDVKAWEVVIDITNPNYTQVVELLNLMWSYNTNKGYYYACNMFGIIDGEYVVSDFNKYNQYFIADSVVNIGDYLKLFGKILFIYPVSIIYNLGYDLAIIFQFVFVW